MQNELLNVTKANVNKFNKDVEENEGYLYTTNAKYSSIVANQRITEVANELIPNNIKTLIDIGCGDGTYTSTIKKAHPHIEVTGIDPSTKAINIATRRFPNINFSDVNIYDVDKLTVRTYNLSVIRGVLHHLSDQSQAINNAFLISDEMMIMEPNGNNFILKWIEKHSKYHIEHEEQSFSTTQLSQWCTDNGWKVQTIKYIGFVPFFFPTLPAKIIHFFQPVLEKIPLINKYLSAQIIICCKKPATA